MKTIKFKSWICNIVLSKYQSTDRIAIQLIDSTDKSLVATATVNIVEENIQDDEVIIKDYSENEGMLDLLVSENIVSEPVRYVPAGFVMVPVCKLLYNEGK